MLENTTTYGTIVNGNYGLTLQTDTARPAGTPAGLLVTRAVETMDGWIGQLLIDKKIVRETDAAPTSEDALKDVNGHVVARLTELFA